MSEFWDGLGKAFDEAVGATLGVAAAAITVIPTVVVTTVDGVLEGQSADKIGQRIEGNLRDVGGSAYDIGESVGKDVVAPAAKWVGRAAVLGLLFGGGGGDGGGDGGGSSGSHSA